MRRRGVSDHPFSDENSDEAIARRNELAVRWLPLVYRIVKDFRGSHADRDDLIGEGRLALVIACGTADPGNERLKYYLARPIKWAMKEEADRVRPRTARGHSYLEIFPDHGSSPVDTARHLEESRALVGRLLSVLRPRERLIVRMAFGLAGDPPATSMDMGRDLGISGERARQILTRALMRMKAAIRSDDVA